MNFQGIILLALIVAAFAVFVRRIIQISRYIYLGRDELSTDRFARRVRDFGVKGFGQSLVLRHPSGIFHALIFWGFFVLTFGTLEGLLTGLLPEWSFAWMGGFYSFMNGSQDLFAFLVLVAIAAAVYRRVVIKPARLKGTRAQALDAFIILGSIALLVVAFYGMRVVEPKPGFTPVADVLRTWTLGETVSTSSAHVRAYHVFAWMHHLVVLGLLAYIPYSKHLHVIAALPNLFFRADRVRGQIPNIDLEDEDAERLGIVAITDFTKKELLDLAACTECGRCQEACPAYATGKPLSPKKVVLDLKAHLFEEGPRLLHDPNAEPVKKLYGDVIASDVLWACTTCFACETVCPVEIQPMTKLLGIRQSRVLMEGDFPEEAQATLRNIETQSNPWGLPQATRADWAEGLGVKTLAEDRDVEYLLFVGCAGAYDQRYMNVTRSLVKLLQHAGVSFGILGTEECCTGDSAKRVGNDYLAQMLAQQNVETCNNYGVKKVVTACPHCFNSIKNELPPFGGHYEVYHHTQLLEDLVRQGSLSAAENPPTNPSTVTYHDSCYLSRYNDIADAPRDVLRTGSGRDPVELGRNRTNSFCCGAGGGRMWMEERLGTRINVERAQEVIRSGCSTVATACPFCMTMLADGIRGEGREDVAVRDVAEVLADSLGLNEDRP